MILEPRNSHNSKEIISKTAGYEFIITGRWIDLGKRQRQKATDVFLCSFLIIFLNEKREPFESFYYFRVELYWRGGGTFGAKAFPALYFKKALIHCFWFDIKSILFQHILKQFTLQRLRIKHPRLHLEYVL